jgi:hypothetical protein
LDPKNPDEFSNGVASRRERAGVPASFLRSHEELADAGQVEKQTDSNTTQPIIVHYHIFRNAGSSVDEILQQNFQSRFAQFEGETPTSILRPQALREFLKNNEGLAAVSSGLLRPPLIQEPDIIPIIFLRDPLDRAYSVYSFERRVDTQVLSNKIARQYNFAGYVDWCLNNQEKGGMVIVNYQVTHLSPAPFKYDHIYKAKPTEADSNAALRYLSSLPCVGIVDEFEASMSKSARSAPSEVLSCVFSPFSPTIHLKGPAHSLSVDLCYNISPR